MKELEMMERRDAVKQRYLNICKTQPMMQMRR